MSDTVHTSILFAAISGVVMMIVGLLFSRFALELMKTPDEVIDMAALYLKIYLSVCHFLCFIITVQLCFEPSEIQDVH